MFPICQSPEKQYDVEKKQQILDDCALPKPEIADPAKPFLCYMTWADKAFQEIEYRKCFNIAKMDEDQAAATEVNEPFPIFRITNRYLLFDINVVTHIRREHHICGVLIGNIPIAAQQNVFSGIPLELMPEEARLLVDKRVAFVVDDVVAHEQMTALDEDTRRKYVKEMDAKRFASAMVAKRQAEARKSAHFEKIERAKKLGLQKQRERQQAAQKSSQTGEQQEESNDLLFESNVDKSVDSVAKSTILEQVSVTDSMEQSIIPHEYTPTTSYPPLTAAINGASQQIPEATSAYYLFAYLHSKGYFMSPGLRFGCQFVAYPGDPLRYHSHFLSVSKDWDEPIDLIDIVGGGRLGTGVKKGFLVGGVEEKDVATDHGETSVDDVRVFCFEWAAM